MTRITQSQVRWAVPRLMEGNRLHTGGAVADTQQIRFDSPIWVGGTLLPSGNHQVLHTMQGDTHIMVFKQQGGESRWKSA